MSSTAREDVARSILRRMVSLPRSIIGGFSRAVDHGIDLIGINGRRNQFLQPPRPLPPTAAFGQPLFPSQYSQDPRMVEDPWAFLNTFEHSYGLTHPFFYACRFMEALKMARDDKKLLFLYLHSHLDIHYQPFTSSFCKETLSSQVVVEFLDSNFVSWAGMVDHGEGMQMSLTLSPASFPFCAVIAPAHGDNITVLQQIEGPVSPAELLEILQRTMEEQGVAFGSLRAKEEEKRRMDRRLREEQDVAYFAALKIDQEKERVNNLSSSDQNAQSSATTSRQRPNSTVCEASGAKEATNTTVATCRMENQLQRKNKNKSKDLQMSQILVRFPNGERREQTFATKDKMKEIFKFVDSLDLFSQGTYRLVTSFPRKVYGVNDQMNVTVKDAGLYPRATLFLEPL